MKLRQIKQGDAPEGFPPFFLDLHAQGMDGNLFPRRVMKMEGKAGTAFTCLSGLNDTQKRGRGLGVDEVKEAGAEKLILFLIEHPGKRGIEGDDYAVLIRFDPGQGVVSLKSVRGSGVDVAWCG